MSYLTDIMKKRQNIQFFKEDVPDKKVIDDILREAHDLIPHKNNFWHYKIRVYGPEHKEEKRLLAISSVGGTKKDEYRVTTDEQKIKELEDAYERWINRDASLRKGEYFFNAQLTAPYVLVYTHQERFLTKHQEESALYQKGFTDKIFNRSAKKKGTDWKIQAGMHGITTAYMCAEKDLHASFCKCYFYNKFLPNDMRREHEKTAFMLGIGYRDEDLPYYPSFNLKALYEEIVEWK